MNIIKKYPHDPEHLLGLPSAKSALRPGECQSSFFPATHILVKPPRVDTFTTQWGGRKRARSEPESVMAATDLITKDPQKSSVRASCSLPPKQAGKPETIITRHNENPIAWHATDITLGQKVWVLAKDWPALPETMDEPTKSVEANPRFPRFLLSQAVAWSNTELTDGRQRQLLSAGRSTSHQIPV
ncbi:uncharacterized protein N7482_005857 [Penicillium canariense]|uniref:Uncharacterized protein n=1 Tax=Penicillium canariense TaxID=189055 RepID=A0A9W9I3B1_9EURO|nr:uncharacterized protein N7482_005857 [Penicillium canariense]KAJ5167076.1 hypothetical protein N7482_005857 [Penicillium canariense]